MTLNRYHAFGIHLATASMVALCTAFLVFKIWYPSPLAQVENTTDIFLLLLAIDVILGPVLTLIVFNPAKPKAELKRDLAIIVLIQLAALLYGLSAVFNNRPVYQVYTQGRFDMVYADDLSAEKLAEANNPHFQSPPLFGFETVAALRTDNDARIRNKIPDGFPASLNDLPLLPKFYVPYEQASAAVKNALMPMENLQKFNPEQSEEIANLIQQYAAQQRTIGYLPLVCSLKTLAVIIDKNSGEILATTTFSPWQMH